VTRPDSVTLPTALSAKSCPVVAPSTTVTVAEPAP
jgi:hypothetical protein